jgi:hypothetical protein
VKILEGRDAILEHSPLLEQFAAQCGQFGAMHWLGYFLGGTGARWKRPCVVLMLRPDANPDALAPCDLWGATLFYELNALGIRTGAFSTDDWEGFRTVIAEPSLRQQVTARATRALIQRGAHLVLTTYSAMPLDETRVGPLVEYPDTLWAEHDRKVTKQRLTLGRTYDETLAKFGKRTRINLRYYRKRLLAEMDCEFLADALPLLREEDFLSLNASARNQLSELECRRRFCAARDLNGGFLIALRRRDGKLLSAIGGWRQGTTTVMHHQLNAGGYERYSLGTVMRSFFLESEIERGTRALIFYHGTNHSMSHAFETGFTRDFVVRRKSLRASVMHKMARFLVSPSYYAKAPYFGGSGFFFASVLTSDALKWHSVALSR